MKVNNDIDLKYQIQKNELTSQIDRIKSEHQQLTNKINTNKADTENTNASLINLRKSYMSVFAEKLDPSSTLCPTCGAEPKSEKLNELSLNFNINKKSRLDKFNTTGAELNSKIAELTANLTLLQDELTTCADILKLKEEELNGLVPPVKSEVPSDEVLFASNEEYQLLMKEVGTFEVEPTEMPKDMEEIKLSIQTNQLEINSITASLAIKDEYERRVKGIKDLEESEKDLAQKLAEWESVKSNIDLFIRFKTDLINEKLSDVFPTVRFKFFEVQYNGGFDDQMCEILYKGVDWANLNTAARINAGMEIICALQKAYKCVPTIWVDGRESVNDLFETLAQTINLVVSKDKELTIKL
jgi:DNA repair exonuclease SbcCD ATPase subunit